MSRLSLDVQELFVISFQTSAEQAAAAACVGVTDTNDPQCYPPFCGPTYPVDVCAQAG